MAKKQAIDSKEKFQEYIAEDIGQIISFINVNYFQNLNSVS